MSNESSEQRELTPMSSPATDFRKLKRSGKASAAEITSFLAAMRGKSPREVLGAVANSNLMQSVVQASIAVAIFILLATLIPWGWNAATGGKDAGTGEVAAASLENAKPEEKGAAVKDPAGEKPDGGVDIDRTDKKSAADKIGVTEEKIAPLDVNPLDGSNDDLLDGLE